MKMCSTQIYSNKNRGFSLIELIIVIAIMATLISILAPQYLKYVEKSRIAADETTMDGIYNACTVAIADKSYYDIKNGDKIVWDSNGTITITATGTSGVGFADALQEYLNTSTTIVKIKSVQYQVKAPYSVTINIDNSTGMVTLTEVWAS